GTPGVDGIYSMKPDGSDVRLVVPNGLGPSWSPDGSKLAYTIRDQGVFVAVADGTASTRLTDGPDWNPAWSPDGVHLAFTRCPVTAACSIDTVNADGTGLRQLTPASAPVPCRVPHLVGTGLAVARARLVAALCRLGRVRRARS